MLNLSVFALSLMERNQVGFYLLLPVYSFFFFSFYFFSYVQLSLIWNENCQFVMLYVFHTNLTFIDLVILLYQRFVPTGIK